MVVSIAALMQCRAECARAIGRMRWQSQSKGGDGCSCWLLSPLPCSFVGLVGRCQSDTWRLWMSTLVCSHVMWCSSGCVRVHVRVRWTGTASCPACGAAREHWWHRFWDCAAWAGVRAAAGQPGPPPADITGLADTGVLAVDPVCAHWPTPPRPPRCLLLSRPLRVSFAQTSAWSMAAPNRWCVKAPWPALSPHIPPQPRPLHPVCPHTQPSPTSRVGPQWDGSPIAHEL